MLADLIFSLNIVIPVFLMILLGYVLKRIDIITPGYLTSGNKIVFYICLPALLFRGVYTADIGEFFDIRLISFALGASVVSVLAAWLIAVAFIKDKPMLGAFTQGSFRGSLTLVGLPVMLNLAGYLGMARYAIVITFVIPFLNVLSIVALTPCSGEKVSVKTTLIAIVKNPSNIAIIFGVMLGVLGLRLPAIAEEAAFSVANMAAPFALICMGGSMTFQKFDERFKFAVIGSFVKVVAVPLLFVVGGYLFGFRDFDLAVLVVMGGAPSAVVGFAMASQMGGDTYVAGMIVVISTLMSAVTLTLFIFALRTMGLLA